MVDITESFLLSISDFVRLKSTSGENAESKEEVVCGGEGVEQSSSTRSCD